MAWNKPIDQPKAEPKKKPTAWRGAAAGGVVALAAIIAAVVIFSGGDAKPKAKEGKKTEAIKEVKPAAAPKAVETDEVPAAKPKKARKDMTPEERHQDDLERVREAQKRQANIPLAHERKPQVFKSASDQILAMVAQMAEGKDMPPLPIDKNFEKEFIASLKEPIVINEDDSDKIKAMKESVIQLRQELSERAEAGESALSILQEYQKHMAEDYKTRSELQQEARRILESGDRAGAQKYVDTMNLALQQMGIKQIDMPMTREERKAWAAEYIKQRQAEKEFRNNGGQNP